MTARLSSDADANLKIKVPLQYVLLNADSALTTTNRIRPFTVAKPIAVLLNPFTTKGLPLTSKIVWR